MPLVTQVSRSEELAQDQAGRSACPGFVAPGLEDEVGLGSGQEALQDSVTESVEVVVPQAHAFARDDDTPGIEQADGVGDRPADQATRGRENLSDTLVLLGDRRQILGRDQASDPRTRARLARPRGARPRRARRAPRPQRRHR